jgi:teichoic acid transport system permease protein
VPRPDIPADPASVWPELRLIGDKAPLREYLRDVWDRREFALAVPLGEMKAQNQDTVFGQLWHLLNPLFLVAVYYLVFGVILDIHRGGVENYIAFLLVGVVTFDFTRTAMQSGSRMIVKNRALVQSINFPRTILPVSALIQETLSQFWAIGVMWVLLILTGVRPNWLWLLVVPILATQVMFNLGMGMLTARLTFHFRDVQQFLPYVLRIWFYGSGVLFPVNEQLIANETLRMLLMLNPMWALIEIGRDAFLDGHADPRVWGLALGWSLAAMLFGFWYFRRAESEYGRV